MAHRPWSADLTILRDCPEAFFTKMKLFTRPHSLAFPPSITIHTSLFHEHWREMGTDEQEVANVAFLSFSTLVESIKIITRSNENALYILQHK